MSLHNLIRICLFLFLISGYVITKEKSKYNNSKFNGVWVGKMIQPDGPRGEEGYNQYLQLSTSGSSVKGKSQIEIPDSKFYGEMIISGTIKNDSLFFREDSIIIQQARDGLWWCLKKGILILDTTTMYLKGEWNSSNCASGRIELHRIFQK